MVCVAVLPLSLPLPGSKALTLLPMPQVLAGSWLPQTEQRRQLNVHEHVSFGLLRSAGVPVPDFYVCHTAQEAGEKTAQLASTDSVVKAQVLTGGRGKGVWKNGFRGGVKLVFT